MPTMRSSGVTVPVLKLSPGAAPPSYAHSDDGAADLRSAEKVELPPGGGRARIRTGIAIALPDGYAALLLPRSGLAAKHGVTCLNAPALIDAGYRGELEVLLVNTDPTSPYVVEEGDRIAQLMVHKVDHAAFAPCRSLPPGSRSGGFGHTGR